VREYRVVCDSCGKELSVYHDQPVRGAPAVGLHFYAVYEGPAGNMEKSSHMHTLHACSNATCVARIHGQAVEMMRQDVEEMLAIAIENGRPDR
jgi:hypothetical protein